MKIQYLKLKNWLLMTALGLLGLTACNSSKQVAQQQSAEADAPNVKQPTPREGMAVMYGVPTVNYILKGKVTDADGKPVPGMQVVLLNQRVDITPDDMQEGNKYILEYMRTAADTTDAAGNFRCSAQDTPNDSQQVLVRDIDGEENGSFKAQVIPVSFDESTQSSKGQGWNLGDRTQEMNIIVK